MLETLMPSLLLSSNITLFPIHDQSVQCHFLIYSHGRYDHLAHFYELGSRHQSPVFERYRLVLEAAFVARHRQSQYQDGPRVPGFPSRSLGSDNRELIKPKKPHRKLKTQSSHPSTQCPMQYEIKTLKQTTSSLQFIYPKTQMAYSTRGIRLRVYYRIPP